MFAVDHTERQGDRLTRPALAVELTGLIAFQNLSSKFNAALGVPPQGFCELPQAEEPRGGAR